MSFSRGITEMACATFRPRLVMCFYTSYQQPQVCRGCLVGILMRQLTEDSTQSLQVQPKPTTLSNREPKGDVWSSSSGLSHHQKDLPSKYPKQLRFTCADTNTIIIQLWHKPFD